ncbi:TetR/AcrR family transcriptional regulator [Roseateles chitinivorans]|uniref:TetR/AcrR family transcriptional regulator n=1 Tax=Roseateles chitinivorans TaxID=2917965 RepID=UPI003D678BE3
MKVSKAQAQANREHVVRTASSVFRERGYDGVGVVDLMAAAGFTHGGFYKQFQSKAELMAESAACGIAQTAEQTAGMTAADFARFYLSREHRDMPAMGCTMAALGGDASRQPEAVRTTFAEGIERLLAALNLEGTVLENANADEVRAKGLSLFACAVGAIVMSRACPDDSPLADEILGTCREEILAALAPAEKPATPARKRNKG